MENKVLSRFPEELKNKLKTIPKNPGVYFWKDKTGKVIYVGKAKNLHNRIKNYTQENKDRKTKQLQRNIYDLEYIIVATEVDALILEATMIRKFSPRYNVMLKDDKRYPFIKITNEPFPRIVKTRELVKDGSSYFGPYSNFPDIRRILDLLEWIFPLRNCNRAIPKEGGTFKKACINYQLKKCLAPCINEVSYDYYHKLVKNVKNFLMGKYSILLQTLKDEMNTSAEDLNFEKAAEIRDKIRALEKFSNKQNMFFSDLKDRDIIGVYQDDNIGAIYLLKMIEGRINNKELYPLKNLDDNSNAELLNFFIKDYYSRKNTLPKDIIVSEAPEDLESLNIWLHNKIKVPKRGDKNTLVSIAKKNAFTYVENKKLQKLRNKSRTVHSVQELKDLLNLPKLPRKMVCMDISTIQGEDTVSSSVYFENGKPLKKNYRHYIITTVNGQDDFASMAETMTRFLDKCIDNPDYTPDMIVIDGGKGQLSSSAKILDNYKQLGIVLLSLAKRVEEVYVQGYEDSVILPKSSSALKLLTLIRDESHRFAITFHRKRRSGRTLISQLDDVSGVSEKIKFSLLKTFGSVETIKNKTISELATVKGVGFKTAENILKKLKEDK